MIRLVAALALVAIGCGALGTNDVELDLTNVQIPVAVDVRLRGARIQADVEHLGDHDVRVRLDAARVDAAIRDLTWDHRLVVRAGDRTVVALDVERPYADGKQIAVDLIEPDADTLAREPDDEIVTISFAARDYWRGRLRDCFSGSRVAFDAAPDISAYRHARELVWLFATPPVGHLEVRAQTPLPIDWPLAVGSTALPLAIAIAWLFLVRRFDRARPEPRWLIAGTFGLGIASQLAAAACERWLWHVSPYLDPRTMGLDHSASAFSLDLLVTLLVVGVIEEGAKLLAAWGLAMHRREFDEPIDGIVFAAAAGIGFATAENISYFTIYRLDDGLVGLRSLECVAGHMMYASLWGYALGQRLVRPKTRVWPWFLLAIALHAMWDTTLEFGIHQTLVQTLVVTGLFVLVIRRALRWGVVGAVAPTNRRLFPVGRLGLWLVAVVLTFTFAYMLIELTRDASVTNERIGAHLLVWSAVWGSGFIAAAYGVAALMPLDVVIDSGGVTFAGASRTWSAIRGATRARATVVVHAESGDLHLGPGPGVTLDEIEQAIRERRDAP